MGVFRTIKKRIAPFAGLVVILSGLVTTGQLCPGGQELTAPEPFTMTIWRLDDSSSDIRYAADYFASVYPHISFNIQTIKADEYEDELLSAWSRGEGPDIFVVPNFRLGKFREFISPMPASVALRTSVTERSWGRNVVTVTENTITMPTAMQVQDRYPNAVYEDAVYDDQIYGLPHSFDTLGMYYNRDLLAKAQVAVPPATWEEFRNAVQVMTVIDEEKQIVQPAAAIGTAGNIPHFVDLLSAIMMQNGSSMTGFGGRIDLIGETESGRLAGIEALDFYTKFADPTYRTYTWNDDQLSALETFTQGNLGMYFGYYSELETIENRAPNLNFSYTKLPQLDAALPVNVANYNVNTVHIGSEHADYAWNFINYFTSEDSMRTYMESTGKIPALKSLIAEKQEDPDIAPFVQQTLTAKSWYHGVDPDAATQAFADMIDEANLGAKELEEIVGLATQKINLTL